MPGNIGTANTQGNWPMSVGLVLPPRAPDEVQELSD